MLIFLLEVNCMAQHVVRGTVYNQANAGLHQVSVMLLNARDSSVVDFAFTDKSGRYQVHLDDAIDSACLKFSHLGFRTKLIPIEAGDNHVIDVPDVTLSEKSVFLDEVIVRDESITVAKDTVTFKTEYFTNGDERNVEDLLKKIPGLNIDEDGTIRIGNQEIEKLMVDGDDLFEKGYRILSKNMPAYPIEEVEVLRNYSANHLLKGIEEGGKVALNLKTGEEFKTIWFGDVEAGAGNSGFREGDGNLMNFGKKRKSYFLGNINNTGTDAVGGIEHIIRPLQSNLFPESATNEGAVRLLQLEPDAGDFEGSRTNFNNAGLASLNSIFNVGDRLKVKTIGFFNCDEIRFERNTRDEVEFADVQFTNTEQYRLKNKKTIGLGKINLNYRISKNKILETNTKGSLGKFVDGSVLSFNGDPTHERLMHKSKLFDQDLQLTSKLSERRVLLLSGRFAYEAAPQNYSVNRFFFEEVIPQSNNVDSVGQFSSHQTYFGGVNVRVLDRSKKGHLLDVQIGSQFHNDKLDTELALFRDELIVDSPAGYQNDLKYRVSDVYANGKYHLKVNDLTFIGRLEFIQRFNSLAMAAMSTSERIFFVNPGIGLEWRINAKNRLKYAYSFTNDNAGIRDVFSDFVLTGFRSFERGTGSLNQLRSSDIVLSHEFGNWADRFFVSTMIRARSSHDYFSTHAFVEQNFVQSEKILAKGRRFVFANSRLDFYMPVILSNLRLDLGYTGFEFQNKVNDSELRDVQSHNYNVGLEVRSVFGKGFNYHAGSRWSISNVRTLQANSFSKNVTFLDLSVVLHRFDAQLTCERHYLGQLQPDNTFYFIDVQARYKLIDDKLSIGIEGRNLADIDTYRAFSVNDLGSTTTTYRLLPRFVLLSAEFRF